MPGREGRIVHVSSPHLQRWVSVFILNSDERGVHVGGGLGWGWEEEV